MLPLCPIPWGRGVLIPIHPTEGPLRSSCDERGVPATHAQRQATIGGAVHSQATRCAMRSANSSIWIGSGNAVIVSRYWTLSGWLAGTGGQLARTFWTKNAVRMCLDIWGLVTCAPAGLKSAFLRWKMERGVFACRRGQGGGTQGADSPHFCKVTRYTGFFQVHGHTA